MFITKNSQGFSCAQFNLLNTAPFCFVFLLLVVFCFSFQMHLVWVPRQNANCPFFDSFISYKKHLSLICSHLIRALEIFCKCCLLGSVSLGMLSQFYRILKEKQGGLFSTFKCRTRGCVYNLTLTAVLVTCWSTIHDESSKPTASLHVLNCFHALLDGVSLISRWITVNLQTVLFLSLASFFFSVKFFAFTFFFLVDFLNSGRELNWKEICFLPSTLQPAAFLSLAPIFGHSSMSKFRMQGLTFIPS